MVQVTFDTKDFIKTMNNVIKYSDGFITETRSSRHRIASKVAKTSINSFYQYLDGLARVHPGMLHHVYEWGEVGNPGSRLYQLKMSISSAGTVRVNSSFLQSTSIPDNGTEPFYDKAEVMEEGQTVVVSEKEAQALFFEVDGEEVFRRGPIVIPNPGGQEVRGSFVKAFNEFYTSYFSQIYLRSINFYKALENPTAYRKNFTAASKSHSAKSIGRKSALEWIASLPGDDLIG